GRRAGLARAPVAEATAGTPHGQDLGPHLCREGLQPRCRSGEPHAIAERAPRLTPQVSMRDNPAPRQEYEDDMEQWLASTGRALKRGCGAVLVFLFSDLLSAHGRIGRVKLLAI